jgi:exodeoxyribonuclease V alpha subunit
VSARAPAWAAGLCAAEVDEGALHLAVEAAGWPDAPPAARRALALLVLALCDARGEGGTRLALDTVPRRLERFGAGAADRDEVARLVAALPALSANGPPAEALFGRPGDWRPFIVDGGHLYDERGHRLEVQLATALAVRLAAPATVPAPAVLEAALAASADPAGRRWTPSQQEAIAAALTRPVTLVSGGPGTGKTAVIGGIVRGLVALGVSPEQIAVAAPTGKAAHRIAELVPGDAPAASTLHRLLGYAASRPSTRAGVFRHHENRPLPHAAVIVDEASMVGLALTEQLVRALRPDARLVLVGDAEQLPAVEAGSVLHDLAPLAVRLRESHRMDPADPAGAALLDAALAIATGSLGARGTPARERPAELPDAGFSCLDPGDAEGAGRRLVAAFVEHWYATYLRGDDGGVAGHVHEARGGDARREGAPALAPASERAIAALLARHGRQRVLTVTRRGFAGAERVNEAFARLAAANAGGRRSWDPLAPGTPVLMTRNDYERGLFNGDAGVIVRAAFGGGGAGLAAVFPRGDGLAAFPLAGLRGALEIAYASTVHKAQGSELDHAALLLPDADLPLLSRELIYTAVTRARRSIVVVGRRALLEAAVARPLERSSGLGERLAARGVIPTAATTPGAREK